MERTSCFVAGAALGVVLLFAGCSTTETSVTAPPDAGSGTSDEAKLKTRSTVTDAYCEILDRCANITLVSYFGDLDTCKRRQTTDLVIDADGQTFDQARSDACAAGLAAIECSSFDRTVFPPECTIAGTLEDGDSCDLDSQCASSQCWHANEASAACGTCKPRAALGGDCTATACDTSLVCVRGKCVAKVKVGGACNTTDKPCLLQLECVDGKCAAPVGAGEPCLGGTYSNCDFSKSLLCNANSDPYKCEPVPFANLGETCGLDAANALAIICRASNCPGIEDLKKSTCVAYAKKGEPCSTDSPCEPPYSCLSGTCRVRDPKTCE